MDPGCRCDFEFNVLWYGHRRKGVAKSAEGAIDLDDNDCLRPCWLGTHDDVTCALRVSILYVRTAWHLSLCVFFVVYHAFGFALQLLVA